MRRIYIIPKSMRPQDVEKDAETNNCPEIVRGIPPVLKGVIQESDLPCVYEEVVPEPIIVPNPMEEIVRIKAALKKIGVDVEGG